MQLPFPRRFSLCRLRILSVSAPILTSYPARHYPPNSSPLTTDYGWAYQHRPNVTGFLLRRQKSLALSDEVKQIAWKAQYRLHKRYQAFALRGKNKNQIVTALGRELLGFVWAIAVHTEEKLKLAKAA